jgi:hypothetical protein
VGTFQTDAGAKFAREQVIRLVRKKSEVTTSRTVDLVTDVDEWIDGIQEQERLRTGHKPPRGQVISEKLRTHPDFLRTHPELRRSGNGHVATAQSPPQISTFPRD